MEKVKDDGRKSTFVTRTRVVDIVYTVLTLCGHRGESATSAPSARQGTTRTAG